MKRIQKAIFLTSILLVAANSYAGRWLTRDPIGFMERDPEPQVNLYTYVDNNSINEFDPLGLEALDVAIAEGADPTIAMDQNAIDAYRAAQATKRAEEAAKLAAEQAQKKLASQCSNKIGKLADNFGKSKQEIKDAIHAAKSKMKVPGNPDVSVDLKTGEIHPINSSGGLGDSIGNIHDFLGN
ncbi:MAG: RHS repeat domain-containing protein [Limisphaerales bacterium]